MSKTKYLKKTMFAFLCLVFLSLVVGAPNGDDALAVVETEEIEEEIPVSDGVGIKFASDTADQNMELFKPTKEWQTVKKNQPIPKGLHVRYNIQTGLVEAKLLDENEGGSHEKERQDQALATSSDDSHSESRLQHMKKVVEEAMADLQDKGEEVKFQRWKNGDKEGIVNMKSGTFSKEELKEALKKFKQQDDDVKDASKDKQNFRTMDQIKEELKGLDTSMKTDLEILKQMLTEYQAEGLSDEKRLHFLSEFDYYLHQIDNAISFVDIGGFDLVVKDLNHTTEDIRREAALVIGSSSQSNPKVQVHAIKSGVLPKLIRMLSIEPTNTLRLRVLYAISCIIRHFPFAQQEFVKNGGIQTLTGLFKQHGTDKLRMKAITLAVDLLDEKLLAEQHANLGDPDQSERLRQYRSIQLKTGLLDNGWCDVIPELLAIQDHDTREKVLLAMKHLADSCPIFTDDRWRLIALRRQYTKLSEEEALEEPNGYFHGVLMLIEEILGKLELMHKNMVKDEL